MKLHTPPALVNPEGKPLTTIEQYEVFDLKVPLIDVVGPRLLVYPPPARERKTAAGLIISEASSDMAKEALVVLLGDGVMLADGTKLEPRVKVGDVIVYAPYAGVEFELEGQRFLLIQESDVRAILTYKDITLKEAPEAAS